MKKLLIIGLGGHAKSLIDSIEANGKYEIAGVIEQNALCNKTYRGYKVIGTDADFKKIYDSGIRYAAIGIGFLGKGDIRCRIYSTLKEIGFILPPIVDPSAVVATDALINEGVFVGKRAVINSNAKIGKLAIINTGAIIEHDCNVGDFSHISVGAVLCGTVNIGKECLISANSTVLQNVNIGDKTTIGAGAIVPRNIVGGVIYKNKIIPEIKSGENNA